MRILIDNVLAVEPAKATFSDLVKEAFIEPIRSVLIIDDQYPTWEQIFGVEGYDPTDKTRWTTKSEILKVIQQFRAMSPALTVDIHDGQHNEEIGSYLHQSDLLVLDYQLEKTEPHGVRAAQIVSDLLNNNHFNLIIVHTAIGDLIDPFNAILMSLLTPLDISNERADAGLKLIGDFEDSEVEGIADPLESIKAVLNATVYVALRAHLDSGKVKCDFIDNTFELNAFRAIADKAGWDADARLEVFDWGMFQQEQRYAEITKSTRELRWRPPGNGNRPWIRTNGGFIAFADKKNTELLKILQEAIEDWCPSPSRLMSSRIRAEISRQGAGAEDSALSDKHAYWQYYQELRGGPAGASAQVIKNHRRSLLEGHAARHTERLLDLVGGKAVSFGLRVLEADPTEVDAEQLGFAAHYAIDATVKGHQNRALEHYNAYISTKPVSGWHLHPGHIFTFNQELWVCLSPSCDLVPMQKKTAAVHDSIAAEVKPFVAVMLTKKDKFDRAKVNSNTLIFLRNTDAVEKYSIYPTDDSSSSPVWRLFLASGYGKFELNENRTAAIEVSYLCGKDKAMKLETVAAQIIGQLRYEYALNLIQKLGVEFTRIGLDFSAPAK